MKLKKFLILFLVLLAQNVFAKQFNVFFPQKQNVTPNNVVIRTVLNQEDLSLLTKLGSLKKEHREAVLLLVDSLYEKENQTSSKKDEN